MIGQMFIALGTGILGMVIIGLIAIFIGSIIVWVLDKI